MCAFTWQTCLFQKILLAQNYILIGIKFESKLSMLSTKAVCAGQPCSLLASPLDVPALDWEEKRVILNYWLTVLFHEDLNKDQGMFNIKLYNQTFDSPCFVHESMIADKDRP